MMIADTIRQMAESRAALARRLQFADASIWLGRPEGFPLAEELEVERLGAVLSRYFLLGGLVSHWLGKTSCAHDGNEALAAALPSLPPDLHGVYTGLPLLPREKGTVFPSDAALPRARGIRLFPATHRFPLSSWMIGTLCEILCQHNLPLFIWHVELTWEGLRQVALDFPRLTIVVETQTQKILYGSRPLFALMRECANILVETSNFAGNGYVEYAVRTFGAERLLFGSFLPVNDPFVPIGMILDADISESEKQMIAGGNLRRLIEGVRI